MTYKTRKDLPCEKLHHLFMMVGWSDGVVTPSMMKNFNKPFINSTIVISAWAEDQLVGCIRVLSDQMFRSVIYDLAVLPEFQGKGIGRELVRRCREVFLDSEWLVERKTTVEFLYETWVSTKSGCLFKRSVQMVLTYSLVKAVFG